jgi:hypothetical protein
MHATEQVSSMVTNLILIWNAPEPNDGTSYPAVNTIPKIDITYEQRKNSHVCSYDAVHGSITC